VVIPAIVDILEIQGSAAFLVIQDLVDTPAILVTVAILELVGSLDLAEILVFQDLVAIPAFQVLVVILEFLVIAEIAEYLAIPVKADILGIVALADLVAIQVTAAIPGWDFLAIAGNLVIAVNQDCLDTLAIQGLVVTLAVVSAAIAAIPGYLVTAEFQATAVSAHLALVVYLAILACQAIAVLESPVTAA
jgi:hypothetical protein